MSRPGLWHEKKFRWLLAALVVVAPFQVLSFFSLYLPLLIRVPLFLAIILIFGKGLFRKAILSLLRLNFANINLLMTIAILGAVYLRQFEEAVIIVVLFALGNTLEEFGVEKSQSALKRLIQSSPPVARVKGKPDPIPLEEVEVGDTVEVKPGDQIPLDGEVVGGSSLVEEAVITGEPLPQSKYRGDAVYAGTINGQGYLEIKITKSSGDTTLARIIDLTQKSAARKARSQTFIERFARIYTPAVILAALLLVVIPVVVLDQPFDRWFTQALTLLLISCPCALVISTPVAFFSALGNASRRGALIKGGRFVEEMGKISAVAFDKTRTLTRGEPVVSDVIPFSGYGEGDVLACAGGMEVFSEHPIAQSISARARKGGKGLHRYGGFQALPGKGVKGNCLVCRDSHHCLGNIKFVTEEHAVGEEVMAEVAKLETQGKTAVVISDNRGVKGVIGVTDEVRKESPSLIQQLFTLNITPVILTGDNYASARFVASRLGIKDVKAELLPEEKVEQLKDLLRRHEHVAMVGEGVNDAPALATSSVGIALGAVGSDVAVENADIALMSNNLDLIPYLVRLGRASVKIIRFNLTAAVSVKFLFLLLALWGKIPLVGGLAMAIFADVGVTVLVILNSLRLYSDRRLAP